MEGIYKYEGTISQSTDCCRDIILGDIHDWSKPPVRLTVPSKALAKYLEDRGWTDDEERYITAEWYYDRNLFLRYVVIPSGEAHRPAKIITTTDGFLGDLLIFGPVEHIQTDKPDPIPWEDLSNWYDLRATIR